MLQHYYIRLIYSSVFTRVSALLGRPVLSVIDATEKKRRGRKTYQASPYIGFMPLAVRRWWSLCGSRSMASRVLTTGCAQKPWEGHAQVMHAMWVQAVVKTLQWHGCLMQGWCLGACREGAQMHRTGKNEMK